MSSDELTPEQQRKRQVAIVCFKKATEAMSKENWDYAIEMLGQCAQLSPDNVAYRQQLRGCQYRKYKNNGSGASMASMRLMGVRSKVKKFRSAKNWVEMDKAAEEGLLVNPWDGQLNADLGEAAIEQGNYDVAVYAWEQAAKAEPKSKEFWKGLASAKELKHDYTGAENCWRKIYELDPMDGFARSQIGGMATKGLMHKSGMQTAESGREVQQGYEESVTGRRPASQEAVNTDDPVAVLEREIRKSPTNKDNYSKLADLHRRDGRLEQALDWFIKGYQAFGDETLREMGEDVRLDMLRKNLETARQKSKRNPDDEHLREGVAALNKELLDQEMEVFGRRVERYPRDMRLKLELAQRLMKIQQPQQATKLLQQASSDVRIEGPVLLLLGKCFLQQKQNVLAMRQFEKAVLKFNAADTPDQFVECHYLLGRIKEETKDVDGSVVHYTEVIGVDYEYKDARTRLEKLQGESSGGLADLGE